MRVRIRAAGLPALGAGDSEGARADPGPRVRFGEAAGIDSSNPARSASSPSCLPGGFAPWPADCPPQDPVSRTGL